MPEDPEAPRSVALLAQPCQDLPSRGTKLPGARRGQQRFDVHSRAFLQESAEAGASLNPRPQLASSPTLPYCPPATQSPLPDSSSGDLPRRHLPPSEVMILLHSVTYLIFRQVSLCNLLFYIIPQSFLSSFIFMLDFPSTRLCCTIFISIASNFWKITWEESEGC